MGGNYSHYLGTNNGEVMLYTTAQYGDNGSNISAQVVTKNIDFLDQSPDMIDRWKTIHAVKIYYVDKGQVSVTVSISVDGGQNWTDSSATTVGTVGADGVIKTKTFWFIKTGQFFMVKVASADKTAPLRIAQIEIEYEDAGEHFSP